eukprot:218986_1
MTQMVEVNNALLMQNNQMPKPTPPKKQQHVPKSYKTVLSGGIAGMIAKTCTAPLERIQMLNQTGATHDTMAGTFRRVLVEGGGLRGLWRGNAINCCRVFPHKSILFGLNEYLHQHSSIRSPFITGAISGTTATVIIYPMTVIRAHLSGTFDSNSSAFGVVRKVIASEGWKGLYRGFGVTLCGALPFEATRIGVYGKLRNYLPTIDTKYGEQPHPIGKLCAGACAGASAAIATYPSDTLRRILQVQCADGMKHYNGVIHCIQVNYREGGVRRFYYGLSAKLVRVIPDAAILFFAYETLKDFFEDVYVK